MLEVKRLAGYEIEDEAALLAALPVPAGALLERLTRALGWHLSVRAGAGGGAEITASTDVGVRLLGELPPGALAEVTRLDLVGDGAVLASSALDGAALRRLSSLGLKGTARVDASPVLGALVPKLGALESLTCSCRDLDPSGFSAIASARGLRALTLGGAVGEPGLHAITALEALERLDLFNCYEPKLKPKDIACLAALKGLRSLRLSVAGLTKATLKEVAKLSSLEELDLSRNDGLADGALAHIGQLPRLQRLTLVGDLASVETARAIAGLSSLKELNLEGNQKLGDEGARALATNQGLLRLNVRRCGLSPAGVEAIGAITSLEDLDVGGIPGTGAFASALPNLPRLRRLAAEHAAPNEADLRAMAALPSLSELHLGYGRMKGGAELLSGLRVTALSLDHCALGAEGMRAISRLERVEWLNVAGSAIDESGLRDAGQLTSLRFLHAGDNPVGAGARHLAALTELRELYLNDAGLDAKAGSALAALERLRLLVLHGNALGDEGAAHLTSLTRLRLLNVVNNRISSEGQTLLRAALPDTLIEI